MRTNLSLVVIGLAMSVFGYAAVPAGAQQPVPAAKPDDNVRLSRDIVTVHVTVSDPYGRFVTGLEKSHFEIFDDHRHHHLICRNCGGMLELDDDIVAPLRDRVRERYNFAVTIDHLALFGWCSHCSDAAERLAAASAEI